MQTASAVVPAAPETCWRLFTDVSLLTSWVPGLESAEIITGTRALPTEIHFVLAGANATAAYTLVYAYDKPRGEVRWEPKLGRQHGVAGFVRFERENAGTLVTYGVEHGAARTADDRELGDAKRLLDAFVARIHALR